MHFNFNFFFAFCKGMSVAPNRSANSERALRDLVGTLAKNGRPMTERCQFEVLTHLWDYFAQEAGVNYLIYCWLLDVFKTSWLVYCVAYDLALTLDKGVLVQGFRGPFGECIRTTSVHCEARDQLELGGCKFALCQNAFFVALENPPSCIDVIGFGAPPPSTFYFYGYQQ